VDDAVADREHIIYDWRMSEFSIRALGAFIFSPVLASIPYLLMQITIYRPNWIYSWADGVEVFAYAYAAIFFGVIGLLLGVFSFHSRKEQSTISRWLSILAVLSGAFFILGTLVPLYF
jgi:hypothetical protein